MLRLVTVVGVLGGVGAAIAEPVRMTNEDIKRAMPGALLEIDTPLRIAIPVKVGTDGLMSAEAGALGLTLGATKDRGRWWTEGDKLCMKWFRWFDARPRCMTLHRDGNRVHWAEGSGESGTATITEAAPVVAAAAPAPARKARSKPADDGEDTAASAAARGPDAPAAARPFVTAGIGQILAAPAPRKAEPSMLGMNSDANEQRAVPAEAPSSRQAVQAPPPRKSAKAPPAVAPTPPTGKSTRQAPSARPAEPPARTLVSFRVSGVRYGDTLNVRSGPSEYHAPVGAIPSDGRGVQIVGTCRELWCPIRHGRLTGWVNRYYLTEDVVQRASARR